MSLLSTIVDGPARSDQQLLLIRSSTAQSCLPILRHLLSSQLVSLEDIVPRRQVFLFSLLYPPSRLLSSTKVHSDIEIYDWTGNIPGYGDGWFDSREKILSAAGNAPPGPIVVVIDSVDTLYSDVGSLQETYKFFQDLHAVIQRRPNSSRLILHGQQTSKILPLLMQTAFSPSLMVLTAHPPELLIYLAKDYLTPPPPLSSDVKFWNLFLPVSTRTRESDLLVLGPNGEGSGGLSEIVVEVVIRGLDASGRKRGVERVLEGWSTRDGPCDLMKLDCLKHIGAKRVTEENAPDPTQNVSFNLSLTQEQQHSRAQVPLPYAHEGKSFINQATSGAIFYDRDSADDIDDDDPDDDLNI